MKQPPHIDQFSSAAVGLEGIALDSGLSLDLDGCLLGQIPDDVPLDKDWAAVAEEICLGLLEETHSEKLQNQLKASLAILDKTTGSAARRASVAKGMEMLRSRQAHSQITS